MSHVAQLGRLPVALLVEPRLRVGRALVHLVGTLLPMEVPLGVAARTLAVIVILLHRARAGTVQEHLALDVARELPNRRDPMGPCNRR